MTHTPPRTGRRSRLAVLACFLLNLLAGCVADALILGWNNERIEPKGVERRLVESGVGPVECWVARSPGAAGREPEAYVLFFVGKIDRAERWTAAVAGGWGDRPVEVWGLNYPGSGGTAGPARMAAVVPAALAAYDAARAVAGARPIYTQAASFGTTAALAVAARRPVAGMITQNPPPLRELILGEHGWWNLWLLAWVVAGQVPGDLDSLANARRVTAPAVFVLHGADEVVPPRYQRRVADAYAGPKRIIPVPGAKHDTPLTREASQQLSEGIDWLWAGKEAQKTELRMQSGGGR